MKITPIREVTHKRIIGIASIWGTCRGGGVNVSYDIHMEKYFYQNRSIIAGIILTVNCRVIKNGVQLSALGEN